MQTAPRLTEKALREHTKSQRGHGSPGPSVPPLGLPGRPPLPGAPARGHEDNQVPGGPKSAASTWNLVQPANAGECVLHLASYDGLAVGDILEVDFAAQHAEFVTVARFGSVVTSAPLRFDHSAGAQVRRIIEGNGQRWTPLPSEIGATPSQQPKSSIRDAEGFVDHASWSPREREHQLLRFKRKAKEVRLAELAQAAQPNLHVTIRQPEKMTLQPWPELPYVKGWLQNTRQAWRVLTAGGDHAERYLEEAVIAARSAKSDAEFDATLERLRCNVDTYVMAEEKLSLIHI